VPAAPAFVALLACPETGEPVRAASNGTDALVRADGARFPLVDGVPELLADGAEEPAFRPDRLARIAAAERTHFWFDGRRRLVAQLLDRHGPSAGATVLDLGCGSGSSVELLLERGYRAIGLDARPEGLAALRARRPDAWLVRAEAERLPFRDASRDAVLALDVLEHVDDAAALREIARVLRPGGLLVASVPAHAWLWSFRDEDAGHRRRYSRRGLQGALEAAGLGVVELRAYQFFLLPLVAAGRLAGRGSRRVRDAEDLPRPAVNRALAAVNRLEVRLGRRVRWPAGSSLLAVALRPA
jgi:SAM-dependent methyltransferase